MVTVLGSIPARCSCWVSQTTYRFNSGGCQLFFSSQYWWLSTPSPAEKLHNGPNGGSPAETLHNGPNGGISSSGVVPRQSQAESTERNGCFDILFHSFWMLKILLLQMLTCTILTRLTSDFRVKCSRASRVCLLTLPCH